MSDKCHEKTDKLGLFDKIISTRNIYNAIYSMESYVFDKGLLDTEQPVLNAEKEVIADNDLALYYALGDKFNHVLISKVISLCADRLRLLFASKDNLFEVSVYFRLKDYSENELKFRPMHTARLTDMICMVCILSCLMYEDDENRSLSDLSKLIPHNFYGNIPSTDVKYLFKRWQTQYSEYTHDIIGHCRTYQKNHRYLTEVSLDIKNFFPSVSPQFLYDYILEKQSSVCTSNEGMEMLRMAISKLLFFKISKDNIETWKDVYYSGDSAVVMPLSDGNYMNCGIPQGLPQSYFFGNLCMVEVKKILLQEKFFDGDSYFYVDDSVIYVKSEISTDGFKQKLDKLNECMERFCLKRNRSNGNIEEIIPSEYIDFQNKLTYKIQFHTGEKSSFCYIDEADNSLDGFQTIAIGASKVANLSDNMDDIDDSISLEKLNAINTVVESEIKRLKDTANLKNEERNASRLKMLKRFKKYFLYRIRLLNMKTKDGPTEDIVKDFKNRFLDTKVSLEDWFEQNEEEIFQSEYRLLIQKLSRCKAKELSENITKFEKMIFSKYDKSTEAAKKILYYNKDVKSSLKMKCYYIDKYSSLKLWMKENISGFEGLPLNEQFENFYKFLISDKSENGSFKYYLAVGLWKDYDNFDNYAAFVAENSSEYQRMLLNAYYSTSIGVACSDDYSFVKSTFRRLRYTELRILTRLRNHDFNLCEFVTFINRLYKKDISNEMFIDMALLSVIGVFVRYVGKPDWVDDLIQTHRITKGLWYNGSKFLNSYTLHNEEHAVTLIRKSVHIIKTIEYLELKRTDYYILFLACYLHDISMVIHPDMYLLGSSNNESIDFVSEQMLNMRNAVDKFFCVKESANKNARIKEAGNSLVEIFNAVYEYFEKKVRNQHPSDSAKFIISKSDTLLSYLEPTLLSFVAKVSNSHGWETADVYGVKSMAKNDTVSLKYLMIIIRLADLFDVANDRVNYHLLRQNFESLPIDSRFHWISHLVTDRLEFDAKYKSDETVELCDKPITETLIVDLYLNVKCLTSFNKKHSCNGVKCSIYDDNICIDIMGTSPWISRCNGDKCTLLCCWMMEKHKYLVPELRALNDYLFSVNNSLIRTNIKIRIKYGDIMKLDADLFDCVVEYLENKSNG